jgi:hypothetical protein
MDASDTIRKNKSKAIYIDQLNKFIAQNPGGDCGNLSTCTSSINNCSHYFASYGIKYDFYTGKNACTECTVECEN